MKSEAMPMFRRDMLRDQLIKVLFKWNNLVVAMDENASDNHDGLMFGDAALVQKQESHN